jgi:hypothetical protein
MSIKNTIPFSIGMMFSALTFAADNAAPVLIDASRCLDIVSPIERLACFEEQANAAQGRGTAVPQQNPPVVSPPRNAAQQPAQSPAPVQPQPPSGTPQEVVQEVVQQAGDVSIAPADNFESNFGLPEEKVNDRKAKADKLIARVAAIKELGRNRFLITLENGQVWEQMETERFALAEGDEVRIYATRWGSSYRLASLSHKGFIQVKRLR